VQARLEKAAFFARRDTIAHLLTVGANPNNKANGDSAALEACIRHLGWEDIDSVLHRHGKNYQTPGYTVSRTRDAIRLLVDHGALWKPDASSLNDARRILYRIEPYVTVELAGLLAKHRACQRAEPDPRSRAAGVRRVRAGDGRRGRVVATQVIVPDAAAAAASGRSVQA